MLIIVPQHQFASLEKFIDGCNNYFSIFFDNHSSRKDEPFYTRFREANPVLASELESNMTLDKYNDWTVEWEKRFPWDKLWEAYKIMSNLIHVGDPYVQGADDDGFLTR